MLVILGVGLLGLGLWRGGLWAIAAAVGGGGLALAWREGRRLPPGVRRATPHLLPDSALEWLRQSHQAMGAWAIEGDLVLRDSEIQQLLESWTRE